jgi:hypothetical protein
LGGGASVASLETSLAGSGSARREAQSLRALKLDYLDLGPCELVRGRRRRKE